MSIIDITIGIILAQFPIYLINRYFFSRYIDRKLNKLEDNLNKIINRKNDKLI